MQVALFVSLTIRVSGSEHPADYGTKVAKNLPARTMHGLAEVSNRINLRDAMGKRPMRKVLPLFPTGRSYGEIHME